MYRELQNNEEPWPAEYLDVLIRMAIEEDIGTGDVTTEAVCPEPRPMEAHLLAKQDGVVAGLAVAARVFRLLDPDCEWQAAAVDGERVAAGRILATVRGKDRAMLSAERTALNFLQHLSGIATLTARYVEAVEGYPVRIMDTRKTIPGLRLLEKHAVRMGGGANHRFGLYDQVLIKENHLRAAGGVGPAIRAARRRHNELRIEVEVENMAELEEALEAGADIILLDNMNLSDLREAVLRTAGKAELEASGSIRLDRVRAVAQTGVDRISIGALTHSAPAMDIAMNTMTA